MKFVVARHWIAISGIGLAALTCGCESKRSVGGTASGSAAAKPAPKLVIMDVAPAEVRAVQDDAKIMNDAFYAGDFETLLRMTHSGVVDRSGGADKAVEAMRTALAQSTARGMKVDSVDFPEKPVFVKTSVREYALVPTRKVMSVGSERAEVVNFQFGVRAIGAPAWTYVDGAQISPENVNKLFPDFPADCPLPVVARKKL